MLRKFCRIESLLQRRRRVPAGRATVGRAVEVGFIGIVPAPRPARRAISDYFSIGRQLPPGGTLVGMGLVEHGVVLGIPFHRVLP